MLNFNDYLGYAKHEAEKERIINEIVNHYRNRISSFSIDLDDDFSESELDEIKREVQRRRVSLNLDHK